MGSLRPSLWYLFLVHICLLHFQPVWVQRVDPVSLKLRQLTEQFQQFQALTQSRLDMLAFNQDRGNSSVRLGTNVRDLNDRLLQTSQDLKDFKQRTKQELGGLREWSRKLERKSKRMEGRLALMERNLRESRRLVHKQKTDPGQDFSNLTLEFQSQGRRLAAFQAQQDKLLVGLKGLQESLKNQALRMTRLEGGLIEALQVNGGYYEPSRRSQTHRGGRILDGQTQSRHDGISYSLDDNQPQTRAKNRNLQQAGQYQGTPNQPEHLKAQKSRSQPESQPQKQIPYPQRYGIKPYPTQKEHLTLRQTMPNSPAQIHPPNQQRSQPQHNHHGYPFRSETHLKPTNERQSRTRPGAKQSQSAEVLSQPRSESYQPILRGWYGGEEAENHTKAESSAIHSLLQLPVRQKIPAQPVPKKDATICNVDSMLFFPTASVENYVTFSQTLPDLHELSACLWLRVEAQHVGTLLSYATEDNDNQLVLYGRNSSSSSSSTSFFPSSFYQSSSSYSLDFVIGDPVHRSLPVRSLLDAHWHHFCIIWSSIQGRFWHYTDRRLTSSGSNFRKGWEVPGGGSVVLGQEQDTVGGEFDPAEGFAGQVAGFRVWNRVLSPAEVEGVAEGRGVPRGVVLGMEDIKELHGEVQQVSCECLEHCV
ncbi:pentraxin-4 [Cheilinus undulatus]|uniref:pentraxin-4 n=1 Tax=Cheilinus undulatus TaxID=241271 RepID=UPI001BD650B2|nr:pentraxin-4 [Cheilinus undulatus]